MSYLVFITSLVLLATEVFYTRLLSILVWRNTAFAVLSLALLGIGSAGLLVYLLPKWFERSKVPSLLAWVVPALGLSIAVSYLLILRFAQVTYLGIALPATLPFFLGGLIIASVFTCAPEQISRLYFFDLSGAALGAFLLLPLLTLVNGPLVVPILGLVACIAGIIFSVAQKKTYAAAFSSLIALLVIIAPAQSILGDHFRVTYAKGKHEHTPIVERWGSVGRVTVIGSLDADSVWFKIDSGVGTPALRFNGDYQQLDFLDHNVLQLAYRVRPYESALIIGPGGGSDVLSALKYGVREITAVEINPAIVDIMLGEPLLSYTGGLYRKPEVEVVVADGRSYVARMPDKVDLIQATFVDTFVASATGSHTLSESYIYTTEAMHDYLDHLNENGILSITRWGGRKRSEYIETVRVIATATKALMDRGVKAPENHIVVVRSQVKTDIVLGPGYQNPAMPIDQVATTLIKNQPFTSAEIERIQAACTKSRFRTFWLPGSELANKVISSLLASGGSDAFYRDFYETHALDVEPVSDDRPFFFTAVRPQHYFQKKNHPAFDHAEKHSSYIGIGRLWEVFAETGVLVLLMILLPLFLRLKNIRGRGIAFPTLGYFSCLGLGYIGVEIGLIQKFSLFLEHPVYSLVVVLASVLLFSGIGSFSSRNVSTKATAIARRGAVALVVCLAAYSLLVPWLAAGLIGLPFLLKAFICVVLVAPLAFLMGRLFPLGIIVIRNKYGHMIPWCWGLNSGFSVMGGILSMMISVGWGYTISWFVFTGIYALTIVLLPRLNDGR